MKTEVKSFYHENTSTFTHLVLDRDSATAAVIDPVLDFEFKSGRTSTDSVDELIGLLREERRELVWILETHAHADHLSAAQHLKAELGGRIAIGEGIGGVQERFKRLFNLPADFPVDGSQFDHLFGADETFSIGGLDGRVMYTPGHTDDSVTYVIGDAAFIGDTLFSPDYGTARCDFPGGEAAKLYASIQKILALPGDTRLFLCHDYPPEGRGPQPCNTVAEQRRSNVHIHAGVSAAAFVSMREERDAGLQVPFLILPAIQVNIRAGRLPSPEDNGFSYLKLPLNAL